ncbi:MAG: archease [Dehalococcoidales bacterium]|nr:archease [Dehalococcoidales bacterium]
MRKYRLTEHTADIGLVAYGSNLSETFANAAYGMFAIITNPRKIRERESRRVQISALDTEILLAEWLNRLIYYFDARMLLFKRFEISELSDTHLTSVCHGEKFDAARHEIKMGIKAATYHNLAIDRAKNRVRVLFDI